MRPRVSNVSIPLKNRGDPPVAEPLFWLPLPVLLPTPAEPLFWELPVALPVAVFAPVFVFVTVLPESGATGTPIGAVVLIGPPILATGRETGEIAVGPWGAATKIGRATGAPFPPPPVCVVGPPPSDPPLPAVDVGLVAPVALAPVAALPTVPVFEPPVAAPLEPLPMGATGAIGPLPVTTTGIGPPPTKIGVDTPVPPAPVP
jgi:hypothetical protein